MNNNNNNTSFIEALKEIINTVEQTGGLVSCNDIYTPVADPTWSDLGEAVKSAHDLLSANGVQTSLTITSYDGDIDEYLDDNT